VIAKRAQEIEPFVVMEVMERAQQLEARGEHLIHLEVGEPDFATPSCIQEAMAKALKDGMTGYTHSLGLLPLREAIAEHYHAKYGVEVSPDRIVVTAGTSPAMWMVFAALLEQGDQVIVSDPHYACYPNFIRFCGGEMVCGWAPANGPAATHSASNASATTDDDLMVLSGANLQRLPPVCWLPTPVFCLLSSVSCLLSSVFCLLSSDF